MHRVTKMTGGRQKGRERRWKKTELKTKMKMEFLQIARGPRSGGSREVEVEEEIKR